MKNNKSENMEKLYDEKADNGDYPSLSEYELGILKAKDDFIKMIDVWANDNFYFNNDTEQYEQDGLRVDIEELKQKLKGASNETTKQ